MAQQTPRTRLRSDTQVGIPETLISERNNQILDACLLLLSGSHIGRRCAIPSGVSLLGRQASCTVQLDDESISRTHAEFSSTASGVQVRDLDSTNGVAINGTPISESSLTHGDLIHVGGIAARFLQGGAIESAARSELYRLGTTEPLTGGFTRSHFSQVLDKEKSRAQRHNTPLALLTVHLVNYEAVVLQHGQPVANHLVAHVARNVRRFSRAQDSMGRTRPNELCLILPHTTLPNARIAVQRLADALNKLTIPTETRPIPIQVDLVLESPTTFGSGRSNPN